MKFNMGIIIFFIFINVCISSKLRDEYNINFKEIIKMVNNNENLPWTATENEFTQWPISKLKSFLSYKTYSEIITNNEKIEKNYPEITEYIPIVNDLPSEYDFRDSNCATRIQNQGQCGSCWAFGMTETISDRICWKSNGTRNVTLSAQDPVSCDHGDNGCKGGNPFLAFTYAKLEGIVQDRCFFYMSGSGYVPTCPSTPILGKGTCEEKRDRKFWKDKYHLNSWAHMKKPTEEQIRNEIFLHGSVFADFKVYSDFMTYRKGVYVKSERAGELGGHAVKIVGWGVDDLKNNGSEPGVPYWIVANSWGNLWGIQGYFWIIRGQNECDIEKGIHIVDPNLDKMPPTPIF